MTQTIQKKRNSYGRDRDRDIDSDDDRGGISTDYLERDDSD